MEQNITYQPETIRVSLKRPVGSFYFEDREAMVGYTPEGPTGLAYNKMWHGDGDGDGQVYKYAITHIASGLKAQSNQFEWIPETEREAQAWIAALIRIADWNETSPRPLITNSQMMGLAVDCTLYRAKEHMENAIGK